MTLFPGAEVITVYGMPEISIILLLGGGFKYFLFSPLFGEDFQFDWYFSDGLKPPTRYGMPEISIILHVCHTPWAIGVFEFDPHWTGSTAVTFSSLTRQILIWRRNGWWQCYWRMKDVWSFSLRFHENLAIRIIQKTWPGPTSQKTHHK